MKTANLRYGNRKYSRARTRAPRFLALQLRLLLACVGFGKL